MQAIENVNAHVAQLQKLEITHNKQASGCQKFGFTINNQQTLIRIKQ